MASIRLRAGALRDLERLAAFLAQSDAPAAAATAGLIVESLEILARHPLIGRPLPNGARELVIHRGRSGYLVQYRYDPQADQAVVLVVRHQRELEPGP